MFRAVVKTVKLSNRVAVLRSRANFSRKVFKSSPVNSTFSRTLLASVIPSVFILKALDKKNKDSIIKEADDLYDANQFNKLHDVLGPYKDSKDPEILWRLARSLYEISRDMNKAEKLAALEEALALVDKALEIDDKCSDAHRWRGILLDNVWTFKSTKGRLARTYDVKNHMERAIELNPKDSTAYYVLGSWHFAYADMSWYIRKIVATVFTSPPTSTYEEALKCFEKAEEISPLFYSLNMLMLAKCFLKLNNKDKAIEFLRQVKNCPVKTDEDREAQQEAEKLLEELGIK